MSLALNQQPFAFADDLQAAQSMLPEGLKAAPGIIDQIRVLRSGGGNGGFWDTVSYGGGLPVFTPLLSAVGLYTPLHRFVAMAAIAASVLWIAHPATMFIVSADGLIGRPWAPLSDAHTATYITWWAAAAAIGLFFALFA